MEVKRTLLNFANSWLLIDDKFIDIMEIDAYNES